jgi:phosphatidylglycerophosphate synthase
MSARTHHRWISLAALALGAGLFVAALYYVDIDTVIATGRRLGRAVPLALLASGLWHLTRTWAWSWCFPRDERPPFARLARVRLAAEAFSYLTISGVAGEPLKVVLLGDRVPARDATASVALERISYILGTLLTVGAGSVVALMTLPLSHLWHRVFLGFAIGAGVIAAGAATIIIRRDSFLLRAVQRADRRLGTGLTTSRIARFAGGVGRQLIELVSGNGTRLAVLTGSCVIAYGCMAAEAWLILNAVGIPISPLQALAIETFSRVASFAAAFIPASLGALEASSLAAGAAVGATAAGAPLALARRLRGLFWAGLGLAIYPRRHRPAATSTVMASSSSSSSSPTTDQNLHRPGSGSTLLYVADDPRVRVPLTTRVAGLPIGERVLRSAFRAHYSSVLVFAHEDTARILRRIARDVRGHIEIVSSAEAWRRLVAGLRDQAVTAIGAGTVVSPALLEDAAVVPAAAGIADVPAGADFPVSGLLRLHPAEAADVAALAARLGERLAADAPLPSGEDVSHGRGRLVLRMRTEADVAAAEETIRRASYKPTDNKLARFNRRMSLPISIALIRTPLTANQLSVALVAIGFYSAWLFSLGHYWPGVLAAFLSLAASVLDGCDGEIARLKYQESALGCWIETFGDYSYYIAIFVGMTIGAVRFTGWPIFYWFGIIAMAGTLITFAMLIYLRSRITAGRPERLHSIAKQRFKAEPTWWSRIIWRISFVATRSAMPYGIMALALVGLTPLVVVLAAIGSNVYWISLFLKLRHLLGETAQETVAA